MNIIKIIKKVTNDSWRDFRSFWLPWVLLAFMAGSVNFEMPFMSYALMVLMTLFILVLIFKPMNIIYGLIGTHGYIGLFFFRFMVIIVLFALIYYGAFFKNAGITYDINQPHVEFNMFKSYESWEKVVDNSEIEALPLTSRADSICHHYYYRVGRLWVLQNTFLTSLMQEPADFFSVSSTFTGVKQSKDDPNYILAFTFTCFLIFHILISWILLGVFISLIYQKFRNT